MKMRAYVDNIQGPGSWDRMHDLIDQKVTTGWTMPPLTVDGIIIQIFPGINREVSLEEVRAVARKALRQVKAYRAINIIPKPPAGT